MYVRISRYPAKWNVETAGRSLAFYPRLHSVPPRCNGDSNSGIRSASCVSTVPRMLCIRPRDSASFPRVVGQGETSSPAARLRGARDPVAFEKGTKGTWRPNRDCGRVHPAHRTDNHANDRVSIPRQFQFRRGWRGGAGGRGTCIRAWYTCLLSVSPPLSLCLSLFPLFVSPVVRAWRDQVAFESRRRCAVADVPSSRANSNVVIRTRNERAGRDPRAQPRRTRRLL